MQVTTTLSDVHSSNLIGVIPGSSSTLKDQYVVYAAHLDHFGIGIPVKGDSVYNGAHDNASGVAHPAGDRPHFPQPSNSAQTLGDHHHRDRRRTGTARLRLFHPASYRAKEGHRGQPCPRYALFLPPRARHRAVRRRSFHLSHQTQAAAAYLGLGIGPDPFPKQVVFIRSDHYSFIRQGIPALFIKSGFKNRCFRYG